MHPTRTTRLLLPVLVAFLASCSSTPPERRPASTRELSGELQTQDRRIATLRDLIRAERSHLDSVPADTLARVRLDHLLAEEDAAQTVRRDMKATADEKAREEYRESLERLRPDGREKALAAP